MWHILLQEIVNISPLEVFTCKPDISLAGMLLKRFKELGGWANYLKYLATMVLCFFSEEAH